jgi:uncharacterized OsmC-like protein
MELVATYLKDAAFEVSCRDHRVISDQPADKGGGDAGMTPPEFLLAALASCAGYYAAKYLEAHGLPAEGLAVRVTAEKSAAPARLSSFRVAIGAPEAASPKHQAGVLRAARHCLIHNTLLNPARIDVMLDDFIDVSEPPERFDPVVAGVPS